MRRGLAVLLVWLMAAPWSTTYAQQPIFRTATRLVVTTVVVTRPDGSPVEGLTEDVLSQVVTFPPVVPGGPKTRFEMLLSAKEHEMHHRGQLMLIERLLGIVPHLTRARQSR